ncbi:MAG: thioredoxin domain-containing protein [Acidobacteria bacterium]|nr:thioredoxin domain-containing protein [Acidobacteriota bacterium]
MKHSIALFTLTTVLCSAPAALAQEAALTRADVERTIRSYLVEHPELLVEMSQALEKRRAAEQRERSQTAVAANRTAVFEDAASPAAGAAKDPEVVTVVEFFDYRCGYCKKVAPAVAKLVAENPAVRVVFKEFPILGPESKTASLAALAAARQGGYAKFHRALMESGDFSEDTLKRLAVEAGLDAARLVADMRSPELEAELVKNQTLAQALDIQATPSFVIGDQVIAGAPGEGELRDLIAKAKRAALVTREGN